MKKQKLPKYIQQKFKKPQFKIGDRVKYEFLGEHGWGIITKINEYNDKITYMVKGNRYSYPCGLQIKEYTSYYAGSIDYDASKNQRNNENSRNTTIEKRNDNQTRKRVSGSNSYTIPNAGSESESTNDIGNGHAKNVQSNKASRRTTKNVELEDAIDKQKNFLRKFT